MYQIGIDIGGTNIKIGLLNEALELTAETSIRFPHTTAQDMAEQIRAAVLVLLEEKGAAAAQSEGGVKRYRPCIPREEAAVQETEHLLERVYQGSVSLMVSSLVKKQTLSQAEIDKLYALLQEMEEKP